MRQDLNLNFNTDLEELLVQYLEDNEGVVSLEKLFGGVINHTYKVCADSKYFLVQQISLTNDVKDAENVTSDYNEISGLVNKQGKIRLPLILKNLSTGKYYTEMNDKFWRVFEYFENEKVHFLSVDLIKDISGYLAEFHKVLKKIDYIPKFSIQNFHNTEFIVNELKKHEEFIMKNNYRREYDFIIQNVKKHYLCSDLEEQLIHGDPKFENFLFKNNKVISIVDFDTLMRGSVLLDVGDAMRSWCNVGNRFVHELFDVAVNAYREVNSNFGFNDMKNAMGLITLELATRYLIDAENRNYFVLKKGYDNLEVQNIANSRECLKYYLSQNHDRMKFG